VRLEIKTGPAKLLKMENPMTHLMRYFFFCALVYFNSGCSSVLQYQPNTGMNIDEAKHKIEKLTYLQPEKWKPDYVEFHNDYLIWGYGVSTSTKGGGVGVNFPTNIPGISGYNINQGSAKSTSKNVYTRLYFEDISRIEVRSKTKLFFHKNYKASVFTKQKKWVDVYHGYKRQDCQEYVDAFSSMFSQIINQELPNTDSKKDDQ
jgi:hypothetical protein